RNRHHALARQPRGAPLREGAPRPLGPPQVSGGDEETAAEQQEPQREAAKPEPALRRHGARGAEQRQPGDEPEPGAGRRREDDDGIGWMHRCRLPSRRSPLPASGERETSPPLVGDDQPTRHAPKARKPDLHDSTRSTQANRRSAAPAAGAAASVEAAPAA